MKKIIALSAASVLMSAPAMAGQYANVEANTGFDAGDYKSTLIETHYGYEGELGEQTTWYVQGGPAFDLQDGQDSQNKVSGKIGAAYAVNENLEVYKEVSVLSGADWDMSEAGVGIKSGFTWRF
jgi:outer membrane autotransporter protein